MVESSSLQQLKSISEDILKRIGFKGNDTYEAYPEEALRFLNGIIPYVGTWQSIDIRIIAYNKSGIWYNLKCEIQLQPLPSEKYFKISLDTKNTDLIILHDIVPINMLKDILEQIISGQIKVIDKTISLLCPPITETYAKLDDKIGYVTQDYKPKMGFYCAPNDVCMDYKNSHKYGWNCIALMGYEQQYKDVKSVINEKQYHLLNEQIHYNTEYDYLSDIATTLFDNFPNKSTLELADPRKISIKAPLFIELEDGEYISQERIEIKVLAHKELLNKRISLKIYGSKNNEILFRKFINVTTEASCKKEESEWLVNITTGYTLNEEYDSVEIQLILDNIKTSGMSLENKWVLYNPKLKLYGVFDKELSQFKNQLFKKDLFERNCPLLLFFCGFVVGYSGPMSISGLDIIALSGNLKECFIIDCKAAKSISDKIPKLLDSINTLKQSEVGNLYNFTPVIFTLEKRSHIVEDHIKEANQKRISVITREGLEELLKIATEREPLSKAEDLLKEGNNEE